MKIAKNVPLFVKNSQLEMEYLTAAGFGGAFSQKKFSPEKCKSIWISWLFEEFSRIWRDFLKTTKYVQLCVKNSQLEMEYLTAAGFRGADR